MHLVKLRKNSGPGPARNVGINFARGKYIAFLDSDDLFTKTALEELTTLAEKYQADVINTNLRFTLWNGEKKSVDAPEMTNFAELTNPKNFSIAGPPSPKVPTLEPADFASRIRSWANKKYRVATCTSFCRRDFLIANKIRFADMYSAEDHIFKFACLCLAEKFLMVPNIVYIVRPRDDSIMRRKHYNPQEYFRKRANSFIKDFEVFSEFMSDIDFFKKHPDYRYAVLNWIFLDRMGGTSSFYMQAPPIYLNPIVEKEFRAAGADCAVAAAHLFDMANIQRLQIARLQYELNALKASK